jgi:hypothetical protein
VEPELVALAVGLPAPRHRATPVLLATLHRNLPGSRKFNTDTVILIFSASCEPRDLILYQKYITVYGTSKTQLEPLGRNLAKSYT